MTAAADPRDEQAPIQDTEDLLGGLLPEPRSLVDQAYSQVEEMIVLLRLRPGQVVSEWELSEMLGIGRTPIREALQRLSREGMVVILPRRGVLVPEIHPQEQLLVLEVRRALERLLARTAATRRSDEEARRFQWIAEKLEECARENDDVMFMRFDRALHLLLQIASHNEYSARAMQLFDGLSRRFWYSHYKEAADMPRCARLHADLATQVAVGDAEGAERACGNLIDYVCELAYASVKAAMNRIYPQAG